MQNRVLWLSDNRIGNLRRVGKANGSRECAPDDRLHVPTIAIAIV